MRLKSCATIFFSSQKQLREIFRFRLTMHSNPVIQVFFWWQFHDMFQVNSRMKWSICSLVKIILQSALRETLLLVLECLQKCSVTSKEERKKNGYLPLRTTSETEWVQYGSCCSCVFVPSGSFEVNSLLSCPPPKKSLKFYGAWKGSGTQKSYVHQTHSTSRTLCHCYTTVRIFFHFPFRSHPCCFTPVCVTTGDPGAYLILCKETCKTQRHSCPVQSVQIEKYDTNDLFRILKHETCHLTVRLKTVIETCQEQTLSFSLKPAPINFLTK